MAKRRADADDEAVQDLILQRFEQRVLAEHRQRRADQDRRGQRQEERQPGFRAEEIHRERRQHHQFAVHEIDHAHDAEQQRHAQRDEHVDQARHQPAGDDLRDQRAVHAIKRSSGQGDHRQLHRLAVLHLRHRDRAGDGRSRSHRPTSCRTPRGRTSPVHVMPCIAVGDRFRIDRFRLANALGQNEGRVPDRVGEGRERRAVFLQPPRPAVPSARRFADRPACRTAWCPRRRRARRPRRTISRRNSRA